MSKPPKEAAEKNNNDDIKLDRKYRHSLPPKSITPQPPAVLRHTQSHRYDSGKKKSKRLVTVSQIPSIMEADNSEDETEKNVELGKEREKNSPVVLYENEKKTVKVNKRIKTEPNNKAVFTFENTAFEGNLTSKRNSTATIRTTSSRAPSLQSLEVVREQYCCCAKRTKCERTLLIVVTVLTIIIVVLVIVVIILAQRDDFDQFKRQLRL